MIPVSLSEKAINAVQEMLSTKGLSPEYGLRIGVKGSGCSGTNFYLGFDTSRETDKIFIIENIKIFIEKKDFLYLTGMKVDFIEDNSKRGFTFVEP